MGTCNNCSYSSVFLPVRFTELCKPGYTYAIIVKSSMAKKGLSWMDKLQQILQVFVKSNGCIIYHTLQS